MDFNYFLEIFSGSKITMLIVVGFFLLAALAAISKRGKKPKRKATQKERVEGSNFRSIPILNKSEIRCFNQLKRYLNEIDSSLYLFPQVRACPHLSFL